MKKKMVPYAIFTLIVSSNLFASPGAPIQRIDVTNLLWNTTSSKTQTAVVLTFDNGGSAPCFTTSLNFQGTMTLLAGADYACNTPIKSVTITPSMGTIGMIYDGPITNIISSGFYLTQINISQNTSPVFDPSNGAIDSTGTMRLTTTTQLTKN